MWGVTLAHSNEPLSHDRTETVLVIFISTARCSYVLEIPSRARTRSFKFTCAAKWEKGCRRILLLCQQVWWIRNSKSLNIGDAFYLQTSDDILKFRLIINHRDFCRFCNYWYTRIGCVCTQKKWDLHCVAWNFIQASKVGQILEVTQPFWLSAFLMKEKKLNALSFFVTNKVDGSQAHGSFKGALLEISSIPFHTNTGVGGRLKDDCRHSVNSIPKLHWSSRGN